MTRSWFGPLRAATSRGRCAAYVTAATEARRPGVLCKRTGTLSLTAGNLLPTGPLCPQHAQIMAARAGRAVTIEEVSA